MITETKFNHSRADYPIVVNCAGQDIPAFLQMKYNILTDNQLNLASSFERWQQSKFGDVLPLSGGQAISQEQEDERYWDKVNEAQELLINEKFNH